MQTPFLSNNTTPWRVKRFIFCTHASRLEQLFITLLSFSENFGWCMLAKLNRCSAARARQARVGRLAVSFCGSSKRSSEVSNRGVQMLCRVYRLRLASKELDKSIVNLFGFFAARRVFSACSAALCLQASLHFEFHDLMTKSVTFRTARIPRDTRNSNIISYYVLTTGRFPTRLTVSDARTYLEVSVI